jgi:hypothetical protein
MALVAAPALKTLSVDGKGANRVEGMQELVAALAGGACPGLTRLELSGTKIGAGVAMALVAALVGGACPNLAHLELNEDRGKGIDTKGVQALAAALAGGACPGLQTLDLRNNTAIGVGDEGARALAAVFCTGVCPICWVNTAFSISRGSEAERALDAAVAAGQVRHAERRTLAVLQQLAFVRVVYGPDSPVEAIGQLDPLLLVEVHRLWAPSRLASLEVTERHAAQLVVQAAPELEATQLGCRK